MSTPDPRRDLAAAFAELAGMLESDGPATIATAQQQHRLQVAIAELQRRLAEDRLRILVAGESKRGKSTFSNALVGRAVLPMGVTPLTAVATTVTYGSPEQVSVTTADGATRIESLAALPRLVTEDGNPSNRLGLTSVVVELDAPLLTEGVELVDTPGTGSIHRANTTEAEIAYQSMDAAILVLSADPPISAAERELLERLLPSSVATFVVLNKADQLSPEDLATATAFTRRVVADAAGRELPVYVCSARQAVVGDSAESMTGWPGGGSKVDGISTFLADFTEYLRTGRASALLTSLRRHASGVVSRLQDEAAVAVRAVELQRGADAGKVRLFREHLDRMQRRQTDAEDLLRGESRRLLGELNADAVRFEAEEARRILAALRDWVDGAGPLASAAIESEGHRVGSEVIAGDVEVWRSRWAGVLRHRLEELDVRLRADLDHALDELRPAARELLGVELTVQPAEVALAPSQRFFYQFHIELDAAGMLVAGLRHRLPGQLGRSRATKYLLELMSRLARQQVGRARADLQQRLAVTTAAIGLALTERYADHGTRMAEALDTAGRLESAGSEEATAELARLADRRERLAGIGRRLGADGESHRQRVPAKPRTTARRAGAQGGRR